MNNNNEGQANGQVPQHGAGCMCPACQMKMGRGCMCGCGSYGMGGAYRFRILRWIFGIVILIIVFFFGVQLGEIKGMLGANYRYRMMSGYGMMHPMTAQGGAGGMMPMTGTSTMQ